MRTFTTIAAAGIALVAAPALADPLPSKPIVSEAPATVAPEPDARRICSVGPVTGSLLPRKVCHTRAEWRALGVDPLAPRR